MPSFSPGPADLIIEGGEASFSPFRFSPEPARLVLTGGTVTFTIGAERGASALTVPQLDYLDAMQPIVDAQGRPTAQFQFLIQQHVDNIIASFRAVDVRDTDQESILARLLAAETLARAANDNAAAAQATAEQVSEAAEQTFGEVDPTYAERYAYWKDFPG